MTRYRMEDGTLLDTVNARASWLGRPGASPYHVQTLYRSRKGRYYVETITTLSPFSGARCEWVSPQAAAAWLLLNEHALPDDLQAIADSISE